MHQTNASVYSKFHSHQWKHSSDQWNLASCGEHQKRGRWNPVQKTLSQSAMNSLSLQIVQCTSHRAAPQSLRIVCKSWPISQVQSKPTGAQVGSTHRHRVVPGTTTFQASRKVAAAQSSWHWQAALRKRKYILVSCLRFRWIGQDHMPSFCCFAHPHNLASANFVTAKRNCAKTWRMHCNFLRQFLKHDHPPEIYSCKGEGGTCLLSTELRGLPVWPVLPTKKNH